MARQPCGSCAPWPPVSPPPQDCRVPAELILPSSSELFLSTSLPPPPLQGREVSNLEVVVVNDSGSVKQASHLLKYDSTMGTFNADVKVGRVPSHRLGVGVE